MHVNVLATLALVFGVQAAPVKRDDTPKVSIPNLGNVNATYIPQWSAAGVNLDPAQTPDPGSLLSFMQANTQQVVSAIGTKTVMDIEAALVFAQVTSALGPSPSDVSVFQQVVSTTPVVVVSSINGPAITIATGTAGGSETTFAGHVFTAAPPPSPNTNHAASGLRLSGPLFAGGFVAAGSALLGALAVI